MANEPVPVQSNSIETMTGDVMNLSNLHIHENYLQYLSELPIVQPSEELNKNEASKNLSLFKIKDICSQENA